MISYLRRVFVESWLGRVTAIVIFLAFVGWGIGDVMGYMGEETDVVAKVGQQQVSADDLATALQSELPTIARQMGVTDPSQIPLAMQRQVAYQILHRLIGQAELLNTAQKLKVAVPDSAVRDEVFSLPYFKGANGQFDRASFNQKLRDRGLTEQRFLDMVRNDLTTRTILQPLAQAGSVSDTMLQRFLTYGAKTRVVDFVSIPFDAQPTPKAPDDAVLQRYYNNHPWMFRTPELRHAKIVVLSPQTVADSITLDEADIKRIYDEQKSRYNVPETRDIQLITLQNQAQATAIANAWKVGGNWQAIQNSAKDAAAVEMPNARPSTIPSTTLRQAVFQAPEGQVSDPLKTEGGWAVFRVTKITAPHTTPYEDAKKDILSQYRAAVAPSVAGERKRKLQDALAGKGLDAIPADLGAVAAAGTLDAQGLTADKEPAPLPASGKLREAIIHQIFTQKPGARATLVDGPDNSSFAVEVDTATPAAPRTFEQAHADVLAAWQAEARKHAANEQATNLYLAAKNKQALAATNAPGAQMTRDAAFSYAKPNKNIPDALMDYLPRMQPGQAVMAEDDGHFLVAIVTKLFVPNPPAPADGVQRLKDSLAQADSDDLVASYVEALSKRTPPHINERAVMATLSAAGFGGAATP
ncbi:SurA N-terminal domain-containing protein [Acetobacter sp. AC2005]|uniref:SurA N-terminal domain-containing protein n=1 Tax=Acetobacter sp. AC2005 TaxID=3134142 RepID=UPI0030CCBB8D